MLAACRCSSPSRARARHWRWRPVSVTIPCSGGTPKMRVTALVLASVLCVCGPAFAQEFELYTNNEDGFKVDFPGTPKVTQTTYKSEYGADLPSRVYTAARGAEKYSV